MTKTVAIISTTIHENPKAYERWAESGRGVLVVAGDRKTPPDVGAYVAGLGGMYLAPEAQDQQFAWSDALGWNCIQRRNAALMWALREGFDYVLTVDDDNYPAITGADFIESHIAAIEGRREVDATVSTPTNFLNTGIFCSPEFHQRGTPYGINTRWVRRTGGTPPPVVVSQAQVLGDPDCDAVDRIANHPSVERVTANVVVLPGTYAAFNSQATLWRRDWAPVMMCMPGIGRYDDIFASFMFARLGRSYGVGAFVGEEAVLQIRNTDHDLTKDLQAELWGMDHTLEFCAKLDGGWVDNRDPLWVSYGRLLVAVKDVLPDSTYDFAHTWIHDWRDLG